MGCFNEQELSILIPDAGCRALDAHGDLLQQPYSKPLVLAVLSKAKAAKEAGAGYSMICAL